MYIAALLLGFSLYTSIVIALGFGFSTWFLLSIEAWHATKMWAVSYVPPLVASIVVAYRGNLLKGGFLTTIFACLLIASNHFQIAYYSLFLIAFTAIYYFYESLRQKEVPKFFKTSVALLGFGILGLLPNAVNLLSTWDYSKESTRGGKSELTQSEQGETEGLSFGYAMRWSYGKLESANLLIPGLYAGGYTPGENSNTVEALMKLGVPKKSALEYAKGLPMYYGSQPFVSGPTYLGAVILFLFLLMFFVYKDPFKWVLLSSSLIALFFSWGENFELLSKFFFDNFPLFNKFRAPSMWLSLTIISTFVGAGFAIKTLIERNLDEKSFKKALYYSAGSLSAICLLFWAFGASLVGDFTGSYDDQLSQSGFPVDAIVDDRIALLKGDAIRSLIFILLAASVSWLWVSKKLVKESIFVAALGALILIDLVPIGLRHLNDDDFIAVRGKELSIPPTTATQTILADNSLNFRVFNTSTDPFNDNSTSYYHQSVGGYSAVKLWRYQDMIEYHLSKGNQRVFDMLNTKYFIQGKRGEEVARMNPGALGSVWFVQTVLWAENADEEIAALNEFNPANEVVIDKRFKENLSGSSFSGEGKIDLSNFHLERMKYTSSSSEPQFAVFSEIWYKGNEDWKAFIDGKEIEFVRVNYILRGLEIPAGNHEIEFRYYPKVFYLGNTISLISSILILLTMAGFVLSSYRKQRAQ
jgi:hypothetical protein